jgi:hypothetical protein
MLRQNLSLTSNDLTFASNSPEANTAIKRGQNHLIALQPGANYSIYDPSQPELKKAL